MKDRDYVRGLKTQTAEQAKQIEAVKKEIINLKKEQKRTERLIQKKEQYALQHPDQPEADPEI